MPSFSPYHIYPFPNLACFLYTGNTWLDGQMDPELPCNGRFVVQRWLPTIRFPSRYLCHLQFFPLRVV